MQIDLCLSGAGVKGSAYVGALKALEEADLQPRYLIGSSAGAITASLIAAGYTADELKNLLETVDYRKFCDTRWLPNLSWFPYLNKLTNWLPEGWRLLYWGGLHKGDYFETWLRGLLAAKGVKTFEDLVVDEFNHNPVFRYRLHITATDVTDGRCVVFPDDFPQFKETVDVARTVRMSMAIPLFFEAVKYDQTLMMDGGLASNFPVWYFDKDSNIPSLGITCLSDNKHQPHDVHGPVNRLKAILESAWEAPGQIHIKQGDWESRTIAIDTRGYSATDFKISKARRQALYQAGYQAAQQFLASGKWRALNWELAGLPHSPGPSPSLPPREESQSGD